MNSIKKLAISKTYIMS